MENATKALLMASGTLIGIMLLALMLYFFRSLSPLEETRQKEEETEQLTAFNEEYTAYEKKLMYGVDLISVLNKAKSNNEKYAEGKYTAFAYGETNSDGSYPFVLVTDGAGTFTSETALAVVYEYAGKGVDADDEDIYSITVMVDGEKKDLTINDDAKVDGSVINELTSFDKGDVIVMAFENDTRVKEINTVTTAASIGLATSYSKVVENALANSVSLKMPENWSIDWDKDKNEDDKAVVVYGPVIDKSTASIRVAKISSSKTTDTSNREYYDIKTTDDTKVYVWDYNQSTKNQLADDSVKRGSITASYIDSEAYSNNKTLIDWTKVTSPVFTLVKTVNGYATEVFMIQPK